MSYIPNTPSEREQMLAALGLTSLEHLFENIPGDLRLRRDLDIPSSLSEMELRTHLSDLASRNSDMEANATFLGGGIYDHYIPSAVTAIIGRSEFYTSYTPYQAEVSQGNLQAIWEFQSLICQITEMDVANASMYDGATALAEAALMASSVTGRSKWLASECIHPHCLETLRTYAWTSATSLVETGRTGVFTDVNQFIDRIDPDTACVMVQSPNFFGSLEAVSEIASAARRNGALLIQVFDPISLGMLKPPGSHSADVCVAEGQSLGVSPGFGGPLLGLFASRKEYLRSLPGRIVGATHDANGRRGYTLTLQAREQHIRREKATSNICTNQALCALAATVYLSVLGKQGLQRVSELCLEKSHYASGALAVVDGVEVLGGGQFFKEFVVKCPMPPSRINARLLEKGIIGGLDLGRFYPDLTDHMLICVTEKRTRREIDEMVGGFEK